MELYDRQFERAVEMARVLFFQVLSAAAHPPVVHIAHGLAAGQEVELSDEELEVSEMQDETQDETQEVSATSGPDLLSLQVPEGRDIYRFHYLPKFVGNFEVW